LIIDNGCKAGLVFNPATPLNILDHVLDKLDMILLMSVVDGGVKTDNIAEIAACGADTFVAGSEIFTSDDYEKTISQMKRAIDNGPKPETPR